MGIATMQVVREGNEHEESVYHSASQGPFVLMDDYQVSPQHQKALVVEEYVQQRAHTAHEKWQAYRQQHHLAAVAAEAEQYASMLDEPLLDEPLLHGEEDVEGFVAAPMRAMHALKACFPCGLGNCVNGPMRW